MAISKSTPYVRYKKDFTSSLHLGTIHIESEYLDRTQKTTIESIHGMTWHNKVVNENKELNLLSDTQLELTDLEKQYWNTGEKRVSVDEIHTLEEVEPNEDGTYTYTVNSMEGEYIEIYDGINNITSTSDGLDGQFEIVYDTTEEDVNGNIALDQVVSQYEITDSGVGTITSAKSTGLTLVNHITEPSKEEVAAIQEYEGQYFTIENTVQGSIKNATLKGHTIKKIGLEIGSYNGYLDKIPMNNRLRTTETVKGYNTIRIDCKDGYQAFIRAVGKDSSWNQSLSFTLESESESSFVVLFRKNDESVFSQSDYGNIIEYTNIAEISDNNGNELVSVKMPVLTTTGKNLFNYFDLAAGEIIWNSSNNVNIFEDGWYQEITDGIGFRLRKCIKVKPNTKYYANFPHDIHVMQYKANGDLIKGSYPGISTGYLITSSETHYINFYPSGGINSEWDEAKRQEYQNCYISESEAMTSYEPHKSNILTVNEEVELRGIGDVQDELDVLNNKLTQRIGKLTLSGTEPWWAITNTGRFAISGGFLNNMKKTDMYTHFLICDKLKTVSFHDDTMYPETNTIAQGYNDNYDFIVRSEIYDTDEFKNYLKSNPITVYYQLETPVIKTVDLTVQNQYGNTIPHIQTQQGITYVSTSSDGLIPVVEMSCSYDTIIKPNTTYTIKLDRPIVSDTMYLQIDLGGTMMMLDADVNAFTIKTPSTLSHSQLRLSGTGNTVKEIIVLEGNRVNDRIEYFEGMKNVENPILIVSNCQYVFGKGGRK